MKDIPLPELPSSEASQPDLKEAKRRLLARSVLVALAAEHRYAAMHVRHFAFSTINLGDAAVGHYTWDLVDSGRFEYKPSHGLEPSAGAFPETPFEHQVHTTLVSPAIGHFEDLARLRVAVGMPLQEEAERIVGAEQPGNS